MEKEKRGPSIYAGIGYCVTGGPSPLHQHMLVGWLKAPLRDQTQCGLSLTFTPYLCGPSKLPLPPLQPADEQLDPTHRAA